MLPPMGTHRQTTYNILDVIEELAPREHKETSNPRSRYLMQCPLPTHDDRLRHDRSGSFSINAEASLFLCFGCGAKGNAFQLRQILGGEGNFLTALNRGHRTASTAQRSVTPKPARPRPTRPSLQGVSIAQLAEAKGLDPDYLYEELAWRDTPYFGTPAVSIPYPDQNNENVQTRYRVGLDKGDRFRWEKGATPRLYGLWNLPQIKERNFVILVEGETDFATLDFHGFPVLAGPGAQNFKAEWVQHFQGINRVYAWCEPDEGGSLFIRRLSESIPNLLVITPPEGIKDANELASQAGGGFTGMVDELIEEATPPPAPFREHEIRTSFITNPEMIGNNFGFVLDNFLGRQKNTLVEALRQGHVMGRDTASADRIARCFDNYIFKKCLNTGEVMASRYKCGDPNCHFCALWLLKEFLDSKDSVLRANMENPSIYRIYLFSQRLHEDFTAKTNDFAAIYKQIRQMLTRLTDTYGSRYKIAKDHLYGIRTRIVGDVAHFEVILMAEHQPQVDAIGLLETHFRRQTGVESVITEVRCHGLQHAKEIFTALMAVRADWDSASNYLCWRSGTKGAKMIQGKGIFYRVSGGSKGRKRTYEELLRRAGTECRICGNCTPVDLYGIHPVVTTRVREVTSPYTGSVYLEPVDYVAELYNEEPVAGEARRR